MEDSIGSPDMIEIGVISHKSVVRRCGFAKQQTHRIAFITKGWLHTDKEIPILLTVNQQVLSIGIQMSRGGSPLFDNAIDVGSICFIFRHRHLVSNVEFGTADHRFSVMQDILHHVVGCLGQALDIIAIVTKGFCDFMNGRENIQISSRANIALIRRETEDRDREFLLMTRLTAEVSPFDGTVGDGFKAIADRVRSSRHAIASRKHNRIKSAIKLW